ncbi:MAG TPA: universal stress protein [Chloroflexota bacterium]|jgi:nucleotide-binding universal stress UspA family protein|nr:universal stress protein [Chloroflexota bacterium]
MTEMQPEPSTAEAKRGRIVVALDGSPRAAPASGYPVLPYVEQFAARTRGSVTLVRAWSPHLDADLSTGVGALVGDGSWRASDAKARNAQHQAERYLEEVVTRLRCRGVAADYELLEGPAGEMIVDEAEGLGAQMVAMTTHGRSGLGRLVLGSVADYVVQHTTCPVLLVRAA